MNQDARHRLEDLLNREIEVARLLSDTLTAERSALTGDAPEAVKQKAAEKIQLLGTIERLESERRALCTATGLSVPTDSANANGSGIAATVAERWRSLMELVAGCRTANEVNGYIINVRQNQIRQLMNIVRGGAPSSAPVTYSPQGKTFAKALRALARA
jgi:flagellar biosynthesis/type III secretory pathway chaperone